jgi:hypothetical protein
MLTFSEAIGFHSLFGLVNWNCPLMQGAKGPKLFPGMQEFEDAHQPQLPDFMQTSLFVV